MTTGAQAAARVVDASRWLPGLTPVRVRGVCVVLAAVALAWLFYDHALRASLSVDGVRYFWLDDDQMISMRYARSLAEGHGLVWNVGDRVEGYSNLAWVLLMALVHGTGAADPTISLYVLAVSFVLHVAIVVLALQLLTQLAPEARLACVVLTAGLLLTVDITYWSVNGFETNLLAVAELAFLVHLRGQRTHWAAWLALACIPLIRADGVHVWAGNAALALVLSKDRPTTLRWLALSLLPTLGHLAWRRAYYGDWLPNTYYVKSLGLHDKTSLGLAYVWRVLVGNAVVLSVAGVAGVALLVRREWRALLLFSSVGATASYCVVVGGDNFWGGRFFAHALPVVWVFASGAAVWLIPRAPWRLPVYAWLLVPLGSSLADGSVNAPSLNGDPYDQVVVGVMLRQHARPGSSVAVIPAGMVPYFSHLRALDLLGKSDPHIAHRPYVPHGFPAHGKYDPEYSFGQEPDLVVTCRPRHVVELAPSLLVGVPHPEQDYVLSILASEAFRERYLRIEIESPFLALRTQVYTHRESPEFQGRTHWLEPDIRP